jgi:hypothetical protein
VIAAAAPVAALFQICRVCRIPISRSNAHLPADERAVGYTFSDVDVCDRCRRDDDEAYGVACSMAARRSQAVA